MFTFSFFGFIVSGKSVMLCSTYTYMYEYETSFMDISGSNDPILIQFTHLFQWVIQSLNIDFQIIPILLQNLLILNFNWYSDFLGP